MEKDEPLVIERTANGYQVRPMCGRGDMVCVRDIMIFQDMGYASATRDYQKTEDTLLGFLASHFTDGESSNVQNHRPARLFAQVRWIAGLGD